MQQKNLNQVNHILKRIRCFCFSIFVVCLTLSVCVPVNAATATEQSVVDDTTQQETKKAEDASLAKTRFLNNMSHDIRPPMNAVLGYAQLMKDELKENELSETSEHLEKLQQSGNLLLSIINNVLDMARIESGRMEIDENYIQVEDIWQDLFEVFDDEAKKKKIAFHLMDIQMPNMDGYKAAQVIRHLPDKDKASIPVIAMTAHAFE